MKNIEYIFDTLEPVNHKNNRDFGKDKLILNSNTFSSRSIYKIIEHLKWMIVSGSNRKIIIKINCRNIGDDATLIMLETVIYYVIKNYNFDIQYEFIPFTSRKDSTEAKMYAMNGLAEFDSKKINKKLFIEKYEKNLFIELNHFRKICINTEENRRNNYLSFIYSDICYFLKNKYIDKEYYDTLGEAIVEIINNCFEHSDGDLLLDIKIIEGQGNIKLLNVTTICFTKKRIGEALKNYLLNEEKGYNNSNEIVKKAYTTHNRCFDRNYNIDNFLMVSCFQKSVTSRKNTEGSGGTGLTILVETLINSSIADYCYVLSGRNVIFLKKPYLSLSDEGLIGFNLENDYISIKPDAKIVASTPKELNCTIHNLSFILKGGSNE